MKPEESETPGKQAEAALQESEKRYRSLFENMMDGFAYCKMLFDDEGLPADFVYLDVNSAFGRLTGLKNVVGKKITEVIPGIKESHPELFEIYGRVASTGQSEIFEIEFKPLGKWFSILVYSPEREYFIVVFDNITERKRAEDALRESEEHFKVIAETAPFGIGVVGIPEANFLYVNTSYEKTFGYAEGELLDRRTPEIYWDQADRDRILKLLKEKGNVADYEVRLKRKDGTLFWGMASARPINFKGKAALMGVFTDITERKRAEEALQESEQKYRNLFDNAGDAIITIDLDARVTSWNQSAERIFGWIAGESIGRKLDELIVPGEMQSEFKKNVQDCIAGKNITGISIVRQRRDGTRINAELTISAIISAEGKIIGLSGIFRDITERKRAEEALKEAHQRLNLHVDNSPLAVVEWDGDFHITRWAGEAQKVFGWAAEEVLGKRIDELPWVYQEDLPGVNQVMADMLSGKRLSNVNKNRNVCKDGTIIHCEWYNTAIQDASGRLVSVLSQVLNVTERKQAEEALCKAHDELEIRVQERTAELKEANIELETEIAERKRAQELIREQAELLDKAQDAIGVRDLEHRLIYWNKGAQRLYGWTAEEIIGKNADELLYKEQSFRLIEAKKSVIEKGEWMGELGQITKDDKEIIVESRWTLVRDNDGKPKSILIINIDITEKKKLEAHLLRAQRMESIGTLAGGIAHDLNNMLTPMMLSLQMLKEKFKDEQSQKLLTILENNSQRSANLIKQVLSFSRGVEGERNPLQAKNIITEIEKVAKETFPRNIEIRTDIQKDPFTIFGDATQLHQVIMNLCVNARDAMPDGGILSITASNFFIDENYAQMHTEAKVGAYTTIAVSDTGTGIPHKILDRIFEPFFTTKEFGKGTGLGLSTALAIVKSHGGFINVYSEVGKGTTFRVYLPSIKTEMQNIDEQQLELLIGNGELVLVTEDEDSVREVTISTLEKYGYNVLAANDGAQAVAEYAQNMDKIKVILMDMMMPVMDGHASIRAIRKINPEVKIIAVSGLAEKEKLKNIADYSNAFLPKPYTAERLLKTIHDVLSAK